MNHLFEDFLTNTHTYQLAQSFWISETRKSLNGSFAKIEPWVEGRFANGKLRYDGNPIYSGFIPSLKKAFRIIQEEPSLEEGDLGAWLNETEDINNGSLVSELVISLELTPQTKDITLKLLSNWIEQDLSKEEMEKELNQIPSL